MKVIAKKQKEQYRGMQKRPKEESLKALNSLLDSTDPEVLNFCEGLTRGQLHYRLHRIYEEFYYQPLILLKERNRRIDVVILKLQFLKQVCAEDTEIGDVLEVIFSKVLSLFYQPYFSRAHSIDRTKEVFKFYRLIKMMNLLFFELQTLRDIRLFIGYNNEELEISALQSEYLKNHYADIKRALNKIEEYGVPEAGLGSFLELAFSNVRKDKFKPRCRENLSGFDNQNYEFFSFRQFLEEFETEISGMIQVKIFYPHHKSTTDGARVKTLARSYYEIVLETSGNKNAVKVTAEILNTIPAEHTKRSAFWGEEDVRKWNKKDRKPDKV